MLSVHCEIRTYLNYLNFFFAFFQKLDPELIEAIFGESEVKKMKLLLNVIREARENSTAEQRVEALEGLEDFVENIDNANDFIKMGGMQTVLEQCLSSDSVEERIAATSLIAAIAKNNMFGANEIIKAGGFDLLMARLRKEKDWKASCRVLSGISAVVQLNLAALQAFDKCGGTSFLASMLRSKETHEKVKERIVFMVSFLMKDKESIDILENSSLTSSLFLVILDGNLSHSIEFFIKGLHTYNEIDNKQLHERHGDKLKSLQSLVDSSEDDETKKLYKEIMSN